MSAWFTERAKASERKPEARIYPATFWRGQHPALLTHGYRLREFKGMKPPGQLSAIPVTFSPRGENLPFISDSDLRTLLALKFQSPDILKQKVDACRRLQ